MTNDRVLLVRHGPGLGRTDRYLQAALDYIHEQEPALAGRLSVYETGNPLPSLDHAVAVVFLLGDPLREWYPSCYAQAVEIADEARLRGIRVVNSPESLSNTVKSVQSRLWRSAGIVTPEYHRFESRIEMVEHAKSMELPLLVRSDDKHARAGLRICYSQSEIEGLDSRELEIPGAMASLVDVRVGYRDDDPRASLYHKKRVLVMGRVLRTKHLLFSESPIVSSKSSVFRRYRSRHTSLHWLAMLRASDRACVRADLEYWRRGVEHEELMLRAMTALGLEFAAIDYSERGDGTVILWEANPHPELPTLAQLKMPRIRKTRARLTSYYQAIVRFFEQLPNSRNKATE